MKILKNFILILAAILVFPAIGRAQISGTYLLLSSYYLMPGQNVVLSGYRFEPNQNVSVNFAGQNQNLVTNSGGSFVVSFPVPVAAVNSQIMAAARDSSGDSASAALTVAGFYPNVTPTSWYLPPGGKIGFLGSGFEPNESIKILRGTTVIATVKTDASGNFYVKNFTLPYTNGDINYFFVGVSSLTDVPITIHSAKDQAYMVLNNYYLISNQSLKIAGYAFGAHETVNITDNGNQFTATTTNGRGNFVILTATPAGGGQQSLIATGQQSGKIAQTIFTLH